MASTREQIIETTSALLEAQGYHATGLNQIVQQSGAPKGSLYYYFPEGKAGLTAEVIERAGREVEATIRRALAEGETGASIPAFIRAIGHHVEASGYRAGGPITTVALETAATDARLSAACRAAYDRWQRAFATAIASEGRTGIDADRLAMVIVTGIEGAIVLSRTYRSREPLERLAWSVARLLE